MNGYYSNQRSSSSEELNIVVQLKQCLHRYRFVAVCGALARFTAQQWTQQVVSLIPDGFTNAVASPGFG